MDNIKESKNDEAARLVVIGAICGDIIGSRFESRRNSTKSKVFSLSDPSCRFTDDTVCTIAIADALVNNYPFDRSLRHWCRKHSHKGYGRGFKAWFMSDSMGPYNSFGNGSAMRVSPVGAIADSFDEAMALARQSAEVTHNHPEGIKGAEAVATSIYYALTGKSKQEIREMVESTFGYNLSREYSEIQPGYRFTSSCQGSVPEAIIAFLDSTDYEDAIRNAVALGGDADTQAAIAGGIAAAYYGDIPAEIYDIFDTTLYERMKMVVHSFNGRL